MNLDYCRSLFAYDDWATGRVMDAAKQLDAEAYTRDFGLAWGRWAARSPTSSMRSGYG